MAIVVAIESTQGNISYYCTQEGYGVIVLNTNYNRAEPDGPLIRVRPNIVLCKCVLRVCVCGGGGLKIENKKRLNELFFLSTSIMNTSKLLA